MKNGYILMILQALLTLLLFFSEGYVRYTTIALFLFIDLILFISLLTKRWFVDELLTFAAIFCSGVFMVFYIFMKSTLTTVFGVTLMLLFLVISMVDYLSKSVSKSISQKDAKFDRLQVPETPAYYYDVEYNSQYDSQVNSQLDSQNYSQVKRPEPVMHIKQDVKLSEVKNKLAAKAVAYELEREATQLKNAEKLITDLKVYDAEKELLKETKALQDAQKKINIQLSAASATARKSQAAKELKKEAAEIMKVQKQINEIQKIKELQKEAKSLRKAEKQIKNINNLKELEKEAKSLRKAESQVKEIQFLNKQEKIVNQAKEIAKAQKEIDGMNKVNKKSIEDTRKSVAKQASNQISKNQVSKPSVKEIVRVKTVKSNDESFYFATENGNKFHEPGCLAIKKVPKNKLILYTSKKDAMKKGLQPCSVCIPK